ncbi:hypothetical protein VTJ04DRAFT_122 [Mycothermus thermophilus]|uniref:uncharacterized protein n=1 Tax=Humicola insolens TaxID=85995 RepID=UPI00374257FA
MNDAHSIPDTPPTGYGPDAGRHPGAVSVLRKGRRCPGCRDVISSRSPSLFRDVSPPCHPFGVQCVFSVPIVPVSCPLSPVPLGAAACRRRLLDVFLRASSSPGVCIVPVVCVR